MFKHRLSKLVFLLFFVTAFSQAAPHVDASSILAKSRNCMACHQVHGIVLGPSFSDVALKYARKKDVSTYLALRILKGGTGTWGQIPMPANPQLSEAEAQQLAIWILAQ